MQNTLNAECRTLNAEQNTEYIEPQRHGDTEFHDVRLIQNTEVRENRKRLSDG